MRSQWQQLELAVLLGFSPSWLGEREEPGIPGSHISRSWAGGELKFETSLKRL